MSSSPASRVTTGKCNLLHPAGDRRDEVEAEREVDEVHGFHQADDQKHDDLEPRLGLGLAGGALDGRVTGQAVAHGGPDGAATQCNTSGDERSRKYDRVIHDLTLLFLRLPGPGVDVCRAPLLRDLRGPYRNR